MATPREAVPPGARHAVVLSGGGSRGAYEVGVLRALFEGASASTGGRPLAARIFTGTSVGSYNAAFLAQQENPDLSSVELLQEVWRRRIANTDESCGNGVFRLRGDPFRPFEPGCWQQPLQNLADLGRDAAFWGGYALRYGAQFFREDEPLRVRLLDTFDLSAFISREPLENLLRETIDLGRLRASANELAVVASDWGNGTVRVFKKADIERLGTGAILASTAIPGLFPPVELDGSQFVDGGVLMNTPFKPAIACGAEVLHVVYVDPLVTELPYPTLPSTIDTFYRLYTIILATQINNDVGTAATINQELAMLGLSVADREDLPVARARRFALNRPLTSRRSYHPVVIHRYRPRTDLGGAGAMLDFRIGLVDSLIQQGYEDAVSHDCEASQCLVPSLIPARARSAA